MENLNIKFRDIRTGLFIAFTLASAAVSAAQWHNLPSPPDYQAMIDLRSATHMQGFQRFILRRAYTSAQSLQSGRSYHSTLVHFLADCGSGRSLVVQTGYYSEDHQLVHSEQRTKFRRGEFSPPKEGSDAAEALTLACKRIVENPSSSAKSSKD